MKNDQLTPEGGIRPIECGVEPHADRAFTILFLFPRHRPTEQALRFIGLPVRTADALPASAIPKSGRRLHPSSGQPQLFTGAAMQLLLPSRTPEAFCNCAAWATSLSRFLLDSARERPSGAMSRS